MAYRQEVEEENPDATYIRALFYKGSTIDKDNAYPDSWYRDTQIWLPNDGFKWELVKMTDDLAGVQRTIYIRNRTSSEWQTGQLSNSKDIWSYGGDGSDSVSYTHLTLPTKA